MTQPMTDPRERIANEPMTRMQIVAVALCVVINMLDGFDALAIAFTAATISSEFGLQPGALGAVFSAGAVGMAIGAFTLAPMGDYIGRRKMILGGLTLIGLGMAFTATVSTLTPLIVLRFITGLGIGAMLASLNTLVAEYSSNKRKNLCISLLHMGYALGGGVGGMVAALLIGQYGWQSVYLFGAAMSLVMLPLVYFATPESVEFLIARRPANALGRVNEVLDRLRIQTLEALPAAREVTRVGIQRMLTPALFTTNLLVWFSFGMLMLQTYFQLNWLPTIVSEYFGYTVEQGIFAGVLSSIGAICGMLLMGVVSAPLGIRRSIGGFSFLTAVFMVAVSLSEASLMLLYALILVMTVFSAGTMAGMYALAARVYPVEVRSSGVGWGIGVGRIGAIIAPLLAGYLLEQGLGGDTLFVLFAIPVLFPILAVTFIRSPDAGSAALAPAPGR